MTEASHPFTPGTKVMVQSNYSHYGAGEFKPDTVLKLHKTGRFTLAGDPSQQWYAAQSNWEADKAWFGYSTKRACGYSIYSTRLRLMDAAAKAEYETAKAKKDHEKRCKALVEKFSSPGKISYELSERVTAAMAELPIQPQN